MDEYFERGETVIHKLTGWMGIIIGERDGGMKLDVSFMSPVLNGGLPFVQCVEDVLIERFHDAEPKGGTPVSKDNVVNFMEFKAKKLRRNTPTEGAA